MRDIAKHLSDLLLDVVREHAVGCLSRMPGQTQSVADSHGGKNVSLFVRIRPDGGHDRST